MRNFLEVLKEAENEKSVSEQAARMSNFEERVDKFMALCFNEAGYSRFKHKLLLKEAETTSDFPTLFGTVLERTIRAKYSLWNPEYKQYVKVGTQNDMRLAWDIALYGNRSLLPVVKERADYQTGSALQDGKFVIGLAKYGRLAPGLSWEAILNDDLGAFMDVADDLVLSAQMTRSNYVTKLFAGASGPLAFTAGSGAQSIQTGLFSAAGTHPIDGGTFKNYVTATPLNATNLIAAFTALRSQVDVDGNPILFKRFVLVVPAGKEAVAMQLTSNNLLIATALTSNSATGTQIGQTSENIILKYPLTVSVNPWLDTLSTTYGPYSWYVFGDPSDGEAIKLNGLRGHESPEVCQKMSDKISLGGAPISPLEGDFDSDSVQWRVRDVFGGTTTDPRYAYGAQSTT